MFNVLAFSCFIRLVVPLRIVKNASLKTNKQPLLATSARPEPERDDEDDLFYFTEAEEIQYPSLVNKIQRLQRTLKHEREAFALRESSLTAKISGLEKAVTDSLKEFVDERKNREEAEGRLREEAEGRLSVQQKRQSLKQELAVEIEQTQNAQDTQEQEGNEVIERVMRVTLELQKRNLELKRIHELTEQKAKLAGEEIERLESQIKTLSLLITHRNQSEMELEKLQERMKRIETHAIQYAPLDDDGGLLDDINGWKESYIEAAKKRKQRRKKEERIGVW
ncbi:hypothetical protein RUND412_009043 [Rhizina undulata]